MGAGERTSVGMNGGVVHTGMIEAEVRLKAWKEDGSRIASLALLVVDLEPKLPHSPEVVNVQGRETCKDSRQVGEGDMELDGDCGMHKRLVGGLL
jgi:hypothetical protein